MMDERLDNFKEKWRDGIKILKSKSRPGDFARIVGNMQSDLLNILGDARKLDDRQVDSAREAISRFLGGDEPKDDIDDCVRWQLLWATVQIDEDDDSITLCRIIIDVAPHLAFECPSKGSALGTGRPFMKHCKHKGIHSWPARSLSSMSTPFLDTARLGNADMIKYIIQKAKTLPICNTHSSHAFMEALQQTDNDCTVLDCAAQAEKRRAQTLEVLFGEAPDIFKRSDSTFENAIMDGDASVVNIFLSDDEMKEHYVSSPNIVLAMAKISAHEKLDANEGGTHAKILHSLLSHIKDAQKLNAQANKAKHLKRATAFDLGVVEAMIEHNLTAVWRLKDRPSIDAATTDSLLHLAVIHQKPEFVTIFLEADRTSVLKKARLPDNDRFKSVDKKKEYYALWHNNWEWRGKEKTRRFGLPGIRTAIVEETIRQVSRMQHLSSIFQESGEQVKELSFDISRFNSKMYKVSEFVYSLINHHENEDLLSYEPTIRYAEFPALDLSPDERRAYGDNTYLPYGNTEVVKALGWLRKKGVERIIELKVPDRMVNSYTEQQIAGFAKDFKIEILDWRFIDLSLSLFDHDVKDRIRELHLYSSGKWAPVRHWLSSDGISTLPNLRTLRINIVKEMMTETACINFANEVRGEFRVLWQDWPHKDAVSQQKVFETPQVVSVFWNPTQQKLPDLGEIAQRVVPTLSRFIQGYRKLVEARQKSDKERYQRLKEEKQQQGEAEPTEDPFAYRPVKVAIIDNGIMSISPQPQDRSLGGGGSHTNNDLVRVATLQREAKQEDQDRGEGGRTLWSRIEKGQSFVDDESKVSPWLFASHPHGTQMANLICAIDPMCQLHVAKVADGRYGTTPLRVQKAVKWARDNQVDIISMSFTITEMPPGLEEELNGADRDGILLLCSAHDEGYNVADAFPADHPQTTTIAACDEYGGLLRNLAESKYQFAVLGSNVAAGKIPFVESTESITGSSAATAIAAGLSSLLLSCERLAFTDGATPNSRLPQDKRAKTPARVKEYFKTQMLSKAPAPDAPAGFEGKYPKYIVISKFGGIDTRLRDGEDTYAAGTEQTYAQGIVTHHFQEHFERAARKIERQQ